MYGVGFTSTDSILDGTVSFRDQSVDGVPACGDSQRPVISNLARSHTARTANHRGRTADKPLA